MRKRKRTKSRFATPSDEKEFLKKVVIAGVSVFVFMGVFTAKEALFPLKPQIAYRTMEVKPMSQPTTTTYTPAITSYTPTITPTVRSQTIETTKQTLGQTKAPIRKSANGNPEKQQSRYVLDGR